jgi:hypothetical protein
MTAREIALKCWGGLRDPLYRQEVWSVEDVIAAIEDGMRQERERCAQIAEDCADSVKNEYGAAYIRTTAQLIATNIRDD